MKAVWITTTILFFSFPRIAQYLQDYLDDGLLRGSVKVIRRSVMSSTDIAALRTMPPDTAEYEVDSFSTSGIKMLNYRVMEGKLSDITEFKFDANGNVIEEHITDLANHRKWVHTFTYDSDGNLLQKQFHNEDGGAGRIEKYNYTAGRKVRYEASSSGTVEITEYKYNDKGQVAEEILYTQCSPPRIYTYTYDDEGNNISIVNNGGSYADSTVLKYDEHGGKVLAERYNANGSMKDKFTWKYDQHHNKVLQEHYNADGVHDNNPYIEYTFDSRGNWIRRLKKTTLYWLTMREISYY